MLYDDELERKKRSRIILAWSRKKVKQLISKNNEKKTKQCLRRSGVYYTEQWHNIIINEYIIYINI